jgi:hypothetical protein
MRSPGRFLSRYGARGSSCLANWNAPRPRGRNSRDCALLGWPPSRGSPSTISSACGCRLRGTQSSAMPSLGKASGLFALGPLYVIPAILLNRYRVALRGEAVVPGLLLLTRRSAVGLVASLGILAVVSVAASRFRPSDATVRERVGQLAPVISDVALRYQIDPRLLAAIVYVTEREQNEPFRDVLERLAMSTFLIDAESHIISHGPSISPSDLRKSSRQRP